MKFLLCTFSIGCCFWAVGTQGETLSTARRLPTMRGLIADYTTKLRGPHHALAAYQDRMSTRGITRTSGVCYQTLMRRAGERNGGSGRVHGHALARPERRRAGAG